MEIEIKQYYFTIMKIKQKSLNHGDEFLLQKYK